MPRILIVKMSSLGDVVHALPVIQDIKHFLPNAQIDWVVEEAFCALPKLTGSITTVFPIALRRWRKTWFDAKTRREFMDFGDTLRQATALQPYDAIIDLQGLFKSAVVSCLLRGPRHGYARDAIKEKIASFFYIYQHHVSRDLPAITRNRYLAALALGYGSDYVDQQPPNFGLQHAFYSSKEKLSELAPPYAAIMPSASRAAKLWPEADWRTILQQLVNAKLELRLFSGSTEEAQRAQRLSQGLPNAQLLQGLPLPQVAAVLSRAELVIGLDSGLTHLAAALGRPTIGIFCDHSTALTPITGSAYCASLGGKGIPPSLSEVQHALTKILAA